MSLNVLFYRLYRLRRLIVAAMIPPMLVWLVIFALKGPAAWALLPLAVLPTTLHALRYPSVWQETFSVSVTAVVVLALAGTISADVGPLGLVLRMAGLALVAFLVFMVSVAMLPFWLMSGPESERSYRTRRWSRLDAETLKSRITLYPGRDDARATCSAAAEDGIFEVTLKQRMAWEDFGPCSSGDDIDGDDEEEMEGLDWPEPDEDGTIPLDVTIHAIVIESTPESHDVVFIEEGADRTSTTRHRFTPGRKGTWVELMERGVPMSRGLQLAFWLQDTIADHLYDEVSQAEGRARIANRSDTHRQLVMDIAKWFVPRVNGATGTG